MKKINWYAALDGIEVNGEFAVDDNVTDTEIEELAKEQAFNEFDWGWSEVDGE